MKRLASVLVIGASALCLQACVSIKLAPAGAYRAGDGTYTLGQNWNDMTGLGGLPRGINLLTMDGPLLNRVYLSGGIADGKSMVRSYVKEKPTPVYRKGASGSEQVEFVADSVAAMGGYLAVETSGVRRAEVAGRQGIQFDLTARTTDGLNISGLGQVVVINDKLYVALYLAPTEHYFDANLAEVKGVLSSLRL